MSKEEWLEENKKSPEKYILVGNEMVCTTCKDPNNRTSLARENFGKIEINAISFPKDKSGNPVYFSKYILRSPACQTKNVTLAVCVAISRDNYEGRKVIRETWGSRGHKNSTSGVVLVFFVGSALARSGEGPEVQEHILEEFEQFGDIVQGDFVDEYLNLTLKSLLMVHWITEYCR